jgi:hypothetical protein
MLTKLAEAAKNTYSLLFVIVQTSFEGTPSMPKKLQRLIDAAKQREFLPAEREAQRRSFAYGNTKIENPRITRQTVDQQAEKLKAQGGR